MKIVSAVSLAFALGVCLPSLSYSQEDLGRESGLPSRIGGNRCEWAPRGATATLQGTFNVNGMQNSEKAPTFTVALYAGGAFVSRQRVKNGGTFYFYCVPSESVFVVAEADRTEIWNFPVGSLAQPPQTNYQDVYVTWTAARDAVTKRNAVISARNSYERTKENQKLFEKALDKIHENNGETSAKLLQQVIANDPKDYVALNELGTIYCDNKKYADAVPLFENALTLKPDFVDAMFGKGRGELALKNIAEAIEVLSRAYKIKPDSADVNHFLGEAFLQNKQGTLAIQHMRKAIELAPAEKAELHLRIAWLYNAAGAKNLAAQEYKQFLEKRPKYADRGKLEQYIKENGD